MKRAQLITSLVGVGYLVVSLGMAAPALADKKNGKCDEDSLKGTYVWTQDGFEHRRILVPTDPPVAPTSLLPADRRPFAYAGREKYDGKGKVNGINTVAQSRSATSTTPTGPDNQPVIVDGFAKYTGTYKVDTANCTAEVRVHDLDVPEFESIYHLFLSPDGDMFTFVIHSAEVVQGGATVVGMELTGVGTAYRVGH